jgi:DNA replication licensing factor MCM7
MALLLAYNAPVNYQQQQEAFREFLQEFKSSQSTSEEAATEAIDGLHIDGDRTSDEYDFMDDSEENENRSGSRRDGGAQRDKRKYMALLQDIADRVKTNIVIELDDLDLVSKSGLFKHLRLDTDAISPLSMSDLTTRPPI